MTKKVGVFPFLNIHSMFTRDHETSTESGKSIEKRTNIRVQHACRSTEASSGRRTGVEIMGLRVLGRAIPPEIARHSYRS